MTTTAPLRRAAVLLLVAALSALALCLPAEAGTRRSVDGVQPVASSTAPAPTPRPAVGGPLPGARTSRSLGLPAALAVLAVVGVLSLQVRVLLAEPVRG